MSKAVTQEIVCEQCKKEQEFNMHHSVNVTMDPGLKQKVLKKELFDFTCSACGYSAQVAHDFLYHDMNKKYIIQLLVQGGKLAPEFTTGLSLFAEQGYKIRVVGNTNDLIEKILIFDSGLKDTAIEVLKANIMVKEEQKGTPVDAVYFAAKTTKDDKESVFFTAIRKEGEPSYLSFLLDDVKEMFDFMPAELAKWPDPRSMIVNFKTVFPNKAGGES